MIHVIGEILVDIFKNGNDVEVFPGGAPFNVASNIAYFGGDVSFYGAVGKDEYGSFLKKYARKTNINPRILKTSKSRYTTQAVVSLQNGERSFKFIRDNGADYSLRINNLDKLNIKKGDIVHIGSLMLSYKSGRNFFYKAVKYIKEKGAMISFDINYRDDIFESAKEAKRIFKRAIKCADILKISSEELEVLSKRKTFKGSVKDVVSNNQVAFISRGDLGSCLYKDNNFIFKETKKVNPIDTTGAGDAFYSYILYELDKDYSLPNDKSKVESVLLKANIVGGIATLKKGAINVVPSLKEIDEILGESK